MSKKLIRINFEINNESNPFAPELVAELLYVNEVKKLTSEWWFAETEAEHIQKEIFWLEGVVGTELVYSE